MKFIRDFRREFALVFFVSTFVSIGIFWYSSPPQTDYMRFLLIVLFAANFLLILWLVRQLWRSKWSRKTAEFSQRLFAKISGRIVRFFERFNFASKRRSNMIFGDTSVSYDTVYGNMSAKTRKKAVKWKNTHDERERLGLLYRYMITNRIKNGMSARASDTPSELWAKGENTEPENELFDIYIETRYDTRREVPAEAVDTLKKTFEREWSIK